MKFKKKLFRIHSWIGIRLSVLFFIVCFSGTIATLSCEIDWLFNKNIRITPQAEFESRNLVINNFKEKYPNARIIYWERTEAPYIADIILKEKKGRRTHVFVNPHTGEIQGEAQLTVKRFFRDLHFFMFIPFSIGYFVVLFFGFMLLISLITALVFYKKWWKKLFKLQINKGSLVFFRSLHSLIGVWSVPFILLISMTGIWYFLERINAGGLYKAVNPKAPKIVDVLKNRDKKQNLGYTIDYDKAVGIAEKEISNLKVGSIVPPRKNDDCIFLVGKSEVPLVRQEANRVYINPYTYEVVSSQKATKIPTKVLLNTIADPLHFGYWGGLTTKIIWFFMGLGISSLVFSGIYITVKRKTVSRSKKKKKVMGIWRYINWSIYGVILFFMYYILIFVNQATIYNLIIVTLGWLVFLAFVWYIFSYRMKKVLH